MISDTPYHLQYVRHVSCMCCCMGRSHPILTWTPYLLCVLGNIKSTSKGDTRVPSFLVLYIFGQNQDVANFVENDQTVLA